MWKKQGGKEMKKETVELFKIIKVYDAYKSK